MLPPFITSCFLTFFGSGKKLEKVKQLNLAPILAEAIRRLYLGEDIHIHKNGPFVSWDKFVKRILLGGGQRLRSAWP